MRSPSSLLVFILSFVSFVVSGPLHSTTHSSRFARNPISSRQFHYPRASVDVCADLSLLVGSNLGSDICLCLSAFPLNVDADLLLLLGGQDKVKTLLENKGAHCTYPDHASCKCSSGNPCDFTCTDGFTKVGDECVCPSPNSDCNGKCGSYPKGCSSAVPRAPKMIRRSVTSSRRGTPASHSGDLLDLDVDAGLTLGSSNPSSGSPSLNLGGLLDGLLDSPGTTSDGLDIDRLVDGVLNSLGFSGPVCGGNQSSGLEIDLDIIIGTDISGTQSLLDTITDVVNSLLSSLLGTTVKCKVESSSSTLVDPNTISVDLQICGLFDASLESIVDEALKGVADSLNGYLDSAKIVTKCNVGGPGCPSTPTLSSSSYPHPSPSTSAVPLEVSHSSIDPSPSSTPYSGIDLSGLLNSTLGEVRGILDSLGLGSGDYNLNTDANLVADVSVGLSGTLDSTGGLADTVTVVVKKVLDLCLGTNITTRLNPNPTPSPTSSQPDQGGGIVVDIDLSTVLDATLSNSSDLVGKVSSAVSGVLARLSNLKVVANVDGGSVCGCKESTSA